MSSLQRKRPESYQRTRLSQPKATDENPSWRLAQPPYNCRAFLRNAFRNFSTMASPEHSKTAISPRREEDFPEWYQQVIRAAELAEPSDVRGCMVIRPWGFGIWEKMQRQLEARFGAT